MGTERRKLADRLEQTKKAIRRNGYNLGIRAAANVIKEFIPEHGIAAAIAFRVLLLRKKPLPNPNLVIKR